MNYQSVLVLVLASWQTISILISGNKLPIFNTIIAIFLANSVPICTDNIKWKQHQYKN